MPISTLPGTPGPTGAMFYWPQGMVIPSDCLKCDGGAYSRTTYGALFNVCVPNMGAATITIATPGVVTRNSHGLSIGDQLYFTTTGALPTGLTANTLYYVSAVTTNSFQVAATRGGASINTTGTQSGVHTLFYCPWGNGDGTTTFNVPTISLELIMGLPNSASGLVTGQHSGSGTHAHGLTNGHARVTLEASGNGFFEQRKNVTAWTDTHTDNTAIGVSADSTSHSTGSALGGTTDQDNQFTDWPSFVAIPMIIKT